jgi:hypothetical protein
MPIDPEQWLPRNEPPGLLRCKCGGYLNPVTSSHGSTFARCNQCPLTWIATYDDNGDLRKLEPGCRKAFDFERDTCGDRSGLISPDLTSADREVFDRFLSRIEQFRSSAEVEAMDWPDTIGDEP